MGKQRKLRSLPSLPALVGYALDHGVRIQRHSERTHQLAGKAQKYLHAAYRSISQLFFNWQISKSVWKALSGKGPQGRPLPHDVDMLRAAIVFAAAGLDATLKQLIRDALPQVATIDEGARERFRSFVETYIGSSDAVIDRKALSRVLTSPKPTVTFLLDAYVDHLTGDSLQSAEQVGRVCTALGLLDESLRKRIKRGGTLDTMFQARHQIVHEFDLPKPLPGSRTQKQINLWVEEALSIAQEVINQVSDLLEMGHKRGGASSQ